MKKRTVIIITIVFIIALSIPLYIIFRPSTFGETHIVYYNVIKRDIKIIEENMDEITLSNDEYGWNTFKDININKNDEQLMNTYNELVKDIRSCYLLLTDKKNKTNALYYENKRFIPDKALESFVNKDDCLKNFEKYSSMELSDDVVLSKRLQGQIEVITSHDFSDSEKFFDAVRDDAITINILSNLSGWLKVESNGRIN